MLKPPTTLDPTHVKLKIKPASPFKVALVSVGAIVCATVLPILDMSFSTRQMANSSLPLLIMLAVPFLMSMIVSLVPPNTLKASCAWVLIAVSSFFTSDAFTVFSDKGDNHTLWPIEIVLLTGLAAGALIAGAVVGRSVGKTPKAC